jgi:hypothetical protein
MPPLRRLWCWIRDSLGWDQIPTGLGEFTNLKLDSWLPAPLEQDAICGGASKAGRSGVQTNPRAGEGLISEDSEVTY